MASGEIEIRIGEGSSHVEKIVSIPIDEEGRYILVVDMPPGATEVQIRDWLAVAEKAVYDWWESDLKFLFFVQRDGIRIRLERIEKGEGAGG